MTDESDGVAVVFKGAGWLFPFYFGVAQYMKDNYDISSDNFRAGGVSAGSVTALLLLSDANFNSILEDILSEYDTMKYNPFLIKDCLDRILNKYVSGVKPLLNVNRRLIVGVASLQRYWWCRGLRDWLKGHVITSFLSVSSYIDALHASCYMPVISGLLPYYVDGHGFYDGELANIKWKKECEDVGFSVTNIVYVAVSEMDNFSNDDVELKVSITPGVVFPNIWRYYPIDPFVLRQVFRLGYLRAKEKLDNLTWNEMFEMQKIYDIIRFCMRTSHVTTYNRVWRTVAAWILSPKWLFIVGILVFRKGLFRKVQYHITRMFKDILVV